MGDEHHYARLFGPNVFFSISSLTAMAADFSEWRRRTLGVGVSSDIIRGFCIGVSDIIQLGGYAAVEYCGGPQMIFRMGRTDVEGEKDTVQHEQESHYGSLIVSGLTKQGLTPEEFVAIMGSFSIGFKGEEKKGLHTRWTMNPYVFDNSYYQELMLGDKSKYFQSDSDLRLMQTPELKSWVEKYAEDQELFFENYARAHVKLSEQTHEATLLGEFEQNETGGY